MSDLAVPPDGLIARTYRDAEEGLSDDGRDYFYRCLLAGMRSETFPAPKRGQDLNSSDEHLIQQRVRGYLPEVELIRAGEEPLLARQKVGDPDPLPF